MADRFAGRVALVTGAARGIGRATAELLARQGAWVAVADRDADRLKEANAELSAAGLQVLPLQADVTDSKSVDAMFAETQAWGGGLDILVNNAGIALRSGLDATGEEDFRHQMDVNVTSIFALSRRAATLMKGQGGGAIVNLASVLSLIARPGIAAYVTSKGAVAALTRALAVELSPDNIRVNAVGPGYIATEPLAPMRSNQAFNDHLMGRTPMGRWGKPEEIAQVIAFLASEEASFIQGQVIIADGGLSIAL